LSLTTIDPGNGVQTGFTCRDAESPIFDFRNFERRWKRARLSAGLGGIRFHDLRYTFASHLIQNSNGNLKVVQELLRHKDILMTQRYSHLSPGYLRQASLTLDKTFANLCATVPLLPQLPLGAAITKSEALASVGNKVH
jgi:hypothetical protein